MSLISLALVSILLNSVSRAADDKAEPQTPVVHFANGDYAAGRLLDSANSAAFLWESGLFARPLQFPVDKVQSIQFPLTSKAPPLNGPYCFELAGGDVFYGTLLALDLREAMLEIPGFGKLHVERSVLQRFYRATADDLIYAGPSGLAGWETTGPADGWRESGGQLTSRVTGAALRKNFRAPPLARYEIELAWNHKPHFELSLGVGDDPQSARQAFRFEVWENELVALRETSRAADLCSLKKLPVGAGRLHLQILLNQEAGRMLVYSAAGEKLGDLTVPNDKSPALPTFSKGQPSLLLRPRTSQPAFPGGLQLVNLRGDIKLQRLTISRWSGAIPYEAVSPPQDDAVVQTRIHQTDGAVRAAGLLSYDPAARQFLWMDQGREQRLEEKQLQDVIFAPLGEPSPRKLRALLAAGQRTGGDLIKVAQGQVWLKCPGIQEPLVVPLAEMQALVVLQPVETPAAGREGRLELTGTSLHGSLVDGRQAETSCLVFQPRHAVGASPLAEGVSGRLVFRDPPPPEPEPKSANAPSGARRVLSGARTLLGVRQTPATRPAPPGNCVLHLRTGDTIACRVQAIDEQGVRMEADLAEARFVPHAQIKALELRPDAEPVKIDKTKAERLLTLPRMQRDNPPTQLIRSLAGDYLRGRLLSLNDKELKVELRLETKTLAREHVARIIWLHADELPGATPAPQSDKQVSGTRVGVPALAGVPAQPPEGGTPATRVQGVPRDGNRLTFFAEELAEGVLSGRSPSLGACRVKLDEIDQLLIGQSIEQSAALLAFHQWKLKPAPEPLPVTDADAGRGEGTASVLVGKPAPAIELDLLDGTKFRLADQKSKVVLLDFWASWCGPCLQAMPQVDTVAREFADHDVRLVTINLEETPERIRTALAKLKLEPAVALDRDGRVAERYGASSIPQTVIIDREGKVVRLFVGGGARFDEQLRQALKVVLADRGSPE